MRFAGESWKPASEEEEVGRFEVGLVRFSRSLWNLRFVVARAGWSVMGGGAVSAGIAEEARPAAASAISKWCRAMGDVFRVLLSNEKEDMHRSLVVRLSLSTISTTRDHVSRLGVLAQDSDNDRSLLDRAPRLQWLASSC